MKSRRMYRQGDVLLIAVDEISDRKLTKRSKVTLAEGEVTGHHHVLEAPPKTEVEVFTDVDAEFVRIMGANGLLTHPEHATIEVPPGDYQRVLQREYTPTEIRQVAD